MNTELLLLRITALAEQRGESLNSVFVNSGVGKNFKSNLKNANPSLGKVTMLANYFGVSVSYLLGKEDTPSRVDVTFTPKEAELMRRMQDLDDDQAQQLLEYMEFLIAQRKKKKEGE